MIMRYFYLLIFVFATNSICFSQNLWFQEGATWVHTAAIPIIDNFGFYETKVQKDTIINGQACKKLVRYSELFDLNDDNFPLVSKQTHSPLFMYATADDNQVYIYQENEFRLLYDFNLQPGEILNTPIPEVALEEVKEECPNSSYLVDSIGTDIINGEALKWISVTPTEESNYLLVGKIYQKIGSTRFYFYPIIGELFCLSLPMDFNFYSDFRCFKDDNFAWQKDNFIVDELNGDCYFPRGRSISTSISNISQKLNDIEVSPSPFTNWIQLSSEKKIGEIIIYNSLGEIITRVNTLNKNIKINLSDQPAGIYYIHSLNNGISYKTIKI